jgi:hypothetical protein
MTVSRGLKCYYNFHTSKTRFINNYYSGKRKQKSEITNVKSNHYTLASANLPFSHTDNFPPKIYLNISLPFYSHSSKWTHSKTFSLLPPSLSHVRPIITFMSSINRSGLRITVSVLCDVTQCAINWNCSFTHHRISKY